MPLVETDASTLAEVVDVNLTGTLNVARAAYPHLRASRGSLTVFTSSSFTRGRASYVAYSASKAALVNMAQGLSDEWADDGIRVNAISPERTDTPMRQRAFPDEVGAGCSMRTRSRSRRCGCIASDLTGQVLDVKRHDASVGQGPGEPGRPDGATGPGPGEPAGQPGRAYRAGRQAARPADGP